MTQKALYQLLLTLGMPVAYRQFKTAQTPPFIAYFIVGNENLGADNKVYYSESAYNIELYTKDKDTAKETMLENLLTSNDIYYNKTEIFIESEEVYQILYEITI